jgi:hypothetical protein
MQQPWDRQKGEGGSAFRYFGIFLALGPERNLIRTAKQAGKTVDYIRKLSSGGKWKSRAQAYDDYQFRLEIQGRKEAIERGRQIFVRGVPEAAKTLCLLSVGQLLEGGDMQEHYNRKGERIGQIPVVKPSTRMQAAMHVIELAGITVPKRIELSGADGREIRIAAAEQLGKLEVDQLNTLLAMLAPSAADEKGMN